MKKFLKKVLLFFLLIIFISGCFMSVYFVQVRNQLILSTDITTIVLGDSHTQNGIDDSLLPNSFNLSASAESYLYSYIKLKYLLKHNPKITKIILAYGQHNLSKYVEKNWLLDETNILEKFGLLYPIFEIQDFWFFIENKSVNIIPYLAYSSLFKSMYSIESQLLGKGLPYIGGFIPNSKFFSPIKKTQTESMNKEISNSQKHYLQKIMELCYDHSISLILINTPTYYSSNQELNKDIVKENLLYMNYSNLRLDDEYFADANHLNHKGAKLFTTLLKKDLTNIKNNYSFEKE